jgi:DNA-binding GntR family transcriptional regulator
MEQVAATGDPLRFSDLNRTLHETIIARCPNEYLLDLLRQTYHRLDRLRQTMFIYLPHRSQAALGEHDHLIALLESRDKDEVERYARWHKLHTVEAYRTIHQVNDQTAGAQRPASGRGAGERRRTAG